MLTMFLPPLCAQWIELNIFKKKIATKEKLSFTICDIETLILSNMINVIIVS